MSGIPDFLKVIRPTDFIAKVKKIDWLNEKVCSVWYEVVEGKFEFEAGQFVNLKFNDLSAECIESGANNENESLEIQRAYSVASAPAGKSGMIFELCVEIIEGGKAGRYFSKLKIGDESKFKGPFGFCVLPTEASKAVMVGTGTGIAPIKAILEDLKNKRLDTEVKVLFGFRYWKDRFYLEELNELAGEIDGDFWICLSRENVKDLDELEEFKNLEFVEGRVTSLLSDDFWQDMAKESDLGAEATHVYICGGSSMIKDVREISLHAGVDKRKIHVEIFD
jgi:ferredoxin-NADP reductase